MDSIKAADSTAEAGEFEEGVPRLPGNDRAGGVISTRGGGLSEGTPIAPRKDRIAQLEAAAKARSAPEPLQRAARSAWLRRWTALLSVAQQRALAGTLVDAVPVELDGRDGEEPPVASVCDGADF